MNYILGLVLIIKTINLRKEQAMNSCGIDWVTGTTRNRNVGEEWYKITKGLSDGDERKEYYKWGYSGFYTGDVTWAVHSQWGTLIQLKGAVSKHVLRDLEAFRGDWKTTRLDLQVSVLLPEARPLHIYDKYLPNRDTQRPKYKYWDEGGGSTLYIGSRLSPRFGRLYDKGVQSQLWKPGNLLRYELQLTYPASQIIYDALPGPDRMTAPIVSTVWDFFNSRNVSPLFEPDGDALIAEVGRSVSTWDTKLNWIQSGVGGTVQRLIDAGYSEQLVKALRLSPEQAEKVMSAMAQSYGQLSFMEQASQ